jgi:hypothetical protein
MTASSSCRRLESIELIFSRPQFHIADLAAEEAYVKRVAATVAALEQGGVRTMLFVPIHVGRKNY